MIYIENNLEKQDVFIPRNDGSTCYVSPYDKGYQDGYQDGIEDCGDCPIQQKEVVLTATTETVVPDQGYAGMDSVFVDARQLALEKYNEGYHEGEEDGAEEQKDKLTSTAFTQNGIYRREDGWNEVEVDVPKDINLGTLVESPQMSDITYGLYIKTFDPEHASVDGWGEIRLYMDTLIGQSKNEQKALMTGTTFTQNGLYRREDGWNEVIVEVPQTGTSCNLESKTETITAETQTILPSSGYDGMSRVTVEAGTLVQNKYDEGFNDGKTAILSGMTDTLITQNGNYSNPNGWSGVTVAVPQTGSSCNLQQKHIDIQSGWTGSTIIPDSGYDGMSVVTISDAGYGNEKFDEGFDRGYNQGYRDGEASCPPCPEIESGVSYGLESGFTGFTITPSSGYDGMDSVEIYDDGYGQEKYDEGHSDGYDEGYQDGLGDCPSPNLEQKSVTLTATTECFTPSSGYDGFSEVCVDASGIYQDGYNDGYNDAFNKGGDYLTFEFFDSGGIMFYYDVYANPSGITGHTPLTVEYSINSGPWSSMTAVQINNFGWNPQITLSQGDIVKVKGLNDSYKQDYENGSIYNHFWVREAYIYGNTMSLIYGDFFMDKTAFKSGSTDVFNELFNVYFECNGIYSHPTRDLILPATSLVRCCYRRMFAWTNISRAPELPFTGTAWESCEEMFKNCRGITSAPDLLSSGIAYGAYDRMFSGCTNLNYVKCLGTVRSFSNEGTNGWLANVASTGTFVKKANSTIWTSGTSGIPSGWTVQEVQ